MKIDPIVVNEAYISFDKCIDIIDIHKIVRWRKITANSVIFVEKFNYNDLQQDRFMEAMISYKEHKHLRGNWFCETMHLLHYALVLH